MGRGKANEYLNNKDLYVEIMDFKKTGVASEKFGEMILLLAKNLINKPSFIGYTDLWKNDMIALAAYTCIRYGRSFNPEKTTNAFAYMTSICINSFKAFLNTQKRHKNMKDFMYEKCHYIEENPFTAIDYTQMKKDD